MFRLLPLALMIPLVGLVHFTSGSAGAAPRQSAATGAPAAKAKPAAADGQERTGRTSAAPDAGKTADASASSRGPTRIDFDDRLVQGQTNRAGAVYLFNRKELRLEAMVKARGDFRPQLREQVYER